MDPSPLIHNSAKLSRTRLAFQVAFTTLGWILYTYLFLPVIRVFGEWVNIDFNHLGLERVPLQDPFIFLTILVIALGCFVITVGWAEYNRRKVGDDRRRHSTNVSPEDVAIGLGASIELAKTLRTSRSSRIEFDEHACPIGIQVVIGAHPLNKLKSQTPLSTL